MIYWRTLQKGSKNPPVNTQILLKAIDGSVALGVMYQNNKRTYFDYDAMRPVRGWRNAPKSDFLAWAAIN